MITIYTADQGIVQIINHCLLRHRKNGGILRSQLCFSLRMLVKYPVIAVLRKISRPLAAVRSTRIHVALSKMENSYIEALIVVFGLRLMILKMVTPHCMKQDSSQYTTA